MYFRNRQKMSCCTPQILEGNHLNFSVCSYYSCVKKRIFIFLINTICAIMTSKNPIFTSENQINNGSLIKLTKREWEVILHLSRGLTSQEIANEICVEPKSVDNYRGRIANKLGLKGRNKLARYSWMNKDILEEWHGLINGKSDTVSLILSSQNNDKYINSFEDQNS